MDITVGEHSGFCFGVKRAVDKAFECAEKRLPCVTLGPLMHNPQEVERLARAGVGSVEELSQVRPGQTVIIRSHGVTPQVYERCRELGLELIDATCPHVAHIHQLVGEYSAHGGAVIIVGEAKHPEVVGIAGWANGPVFILPDEEAARRARLPGSALIVAQTTIRRELFERVLEAVREQVADLTVRMTICAATSERQKEAERLCAQADAMIVVGGRNSSNTQKLYQTCALRCARVILAQSPEDIPEGFVSADDRVAITAGASTPQWLLEQVKERVLALAGGAK